MESQTIGIVVVIISLVVLLLASNEKKKSKGKENASIKKESTESSMTESISSELEDRSGTENQPKPLKDFKQSSEGIESKLARLYDVMNHIRWIGLSIGGMFALTFILPQCTGG